MKAFVRVADGVTSRPLIESVMLAGLIAIPVDAAYVAKMLGRGLLML